MKKKVSYVLMILGSLIVLGSLFTMVIVRMGMMKDLTSTQYFWVFGWKPSLTMFAGLIPILIAYHREGLL